MECNKEEASRAKDIAEKKMQSKDFPGARKFLMKAQQLYPEIGNISQLLSVCDVHCSETKFGNVKDWYDILQVEQSADDLLIRKQYRKFALLLHPDKNKYPGAEAAFKLIGEAQRILLDKEKRFLHDMRLKTSCKQVILNQQPQSSPQNNNPSNSESHVKDSNLPQQGKPQHARPANGKETFWTRCPQCSTEYQYFKEILGKPLLCQSCKRPFVSYDMHTRRSDTTQPEFSPESVPNKPTSNGRPEANNVKPTFGSGFQADQKTEFNRSPKTKKSRAGPNEKERQVDEASKLGKTNGSRGKRLSESGESYESNSSLDLEEVEIHTAVNGNPRTSRSKRNKRQVSYNEKACGDEQVVTPSKKAKQNDSTQGKLDTSNVSGSTFEEDTQKKECNTDNGNEKLSGSSMNSFDDGLDTSHELTPDSTPKPTYFEYPDPEFCDFDKSKEEHCFKVGQLWALYDIVDAMPRYYAKIKKIYGTGFKLQITWLEADPDDEVGIEWMNSDLPLACGKFKIGSTENTQDRLMFSHLVSGFKSIGRKSFMIYPREGEIWAIFKNWDAKWWYLLPENERKFEFETVQVLSDNDVIRVVMLDQVEGFTSVYKPRKIRDSLVTREIPRVELRRFSHQIPSFKLTNERGGSLKGCFELDLAAFPH